MKLAVDVGYGEAQALAAGVLFEDWADAKATREIRVMVNKVQPYEPGQFYKRELPCIAELVNALECKLDTIVVDGFVWLSNNAENPKPGLGAYLYDHLNQQVAVIGVAKTNFAGSGAAQLLRGKSKRSLYITAAGVELVEAIHFINLMHGRHRIPTLLNRVDQLSREL